MQIKTFANMRDDGSGLPGHIHRCPRGEFDFVGARTDWHRDGTDRPKHYVYSSSTVVLHEWVTSELAYP